MDVKPVIRKIETVLSHPTIYWNTPESTSVSSVCVYRSTQKEGVYSQISSFAASSGSWTLSTTDSAGDYDDWYKIKFKGGGVYSNFSNSVTSNGMEYLCSVNDVKTVLETVGRWTDEEVFDVIKDVEDELYLEMGRPIAASWSVVSKDSSSSYEKTYYVGEEDVYRFDRVFYGTTTKSELFQNDGFTVNYANGMVRLSTSASGGVTMNDTCEVEIHYVPKIFSKLAKYMVAQRLLEKADMTSGGKFSKELNVINARLKSVEQLVYNKYSLALTSDFKLYDKKYGINRKYVYQDHDRNSYLGTFGFE